MLPARPHQHAVKPVPNGRLGYGPGPTHPPRGGGGVWIRKSAFKNVSFLFWGNIAGKMSIVFSKHSGPQCGGNDSPVWENRGRTHPRGPTPRSLKSTDEAGGLRRPGGGGMPMERRGPSTRTWRSRLGVKCWRGRAAGSGQGRGGQVTGPPIRWVGIEAGGGGGGVLRIRAPPMRAGAGGRGGGYLDVHGVGLRGPHPPKQRPVRRKMNGGTLLVGGIHQQRSAVCVRTGDSLP